MTACIDGFASAEGFDPKALRDAFAGFPSGITAVCAMIGDEPVGMAASSFTSVSLKPPLVSVCMAATSTTWPRLASLPRIGLSVLAQGHDGTCRALASSGDRFADVRWWATASGAVLIEDSALTLETSVHARLVAGDHEIVVLRIHGLIANHEREPLVFHRSRFRGLVD